MPLQFPQSVLGTYVPSNSITTFGGKKLQGYSDDSVIEISAMTEEHWNTKVGLDRRILREFQPESRVLVAEMSFQPDSPTVAYLEGIRNLDIRQGNQILPFTFTEKFTGGGVEAGAAYIQNNPSISRGSEAGAYEPSFVLADATKRNAVKP